MAIPFPRYAEIKDKFCIVYLGLSEDYVLQLSHMRTYFESSFPGIIVHLCFRDQFVCNLQFLKEDIEKGYIFPQSDLKAKKRSFAHVREITCNLQEHPIETFLKESDLRTPVLQKINVAETKTFHICPHGNYPTKSMSQQQIEKAKNLAQQKGFLLIDDCNAGWIIGPENENTFQAAINGKKVTLVDNGFGGNFFQDMFPNIEVVCWND